MSDSKNTNPKNTKSFKQGYDSYLKDPSIECPYKSGKNMKFNVRREYWMFGWYEAKIEYKCGDTLKKHNKDW